MKDGFLRVAAASAELRVADPVYKCEQMKALIDQAASQQVQVLVFPELCVTGSTCGDLFHQSVLLRGAKTAFLELVKDSPQGMLIFAGLPWEEEHRVYNVLAAFGGGEVLGLVPKGFLSGPDRQLFSPGPQDCEILWLDDGSGEEYEVPFGRRLLFADEELPGLLIGAEVGEELRAFVSPGTELAAAGATLLVNGSAFPGLTGQKERRCRQVAETSARLLCGYVNANAGTGESTTDLVMGGQHLIAELGEVLAESACLESGLIIADLDLERIGNERRRQEERIPETDCDWLVQSIYLEKEALELSRAVAPLPFVPSEKARLYDRCEEILAIQAMGLKKRLQHTNCRSAVIGISGGLDSTLALLVVARAFDLLDLPRTCITAVTMPCFGTTDRTYQNACELTRRLGAELREVPIQEAVGLHFRDIGQDESVHDVTYENSQARERTQVLMDLANQTGGMVIGTGDLSELALGWATYNGDHMSMYGVNASVPKTLVRYLVRHAAETAEDPALKEVLLDILDTPVSPELLPPSEGQISQKTEDLVGPYELHDFFLYYLLRWGFGPAKILRLAQKAFADTYDKETILRWMAVFCRRFFSQQFKRSCLPDGPKVGSVSLSPRGDLRMPSDACSRLWLEEIRKLEQ